MGVGGTSPPSRNKLTQPEGPIAKSVEGRGRCRKSQKFGHFSGYITKEKDWWGKKAKKS